jgi:hypothetical protein
MPLDEPIYFKKTNFEKNVQNGLNWGFLRGQEISFRDNVPLFEGLEK